MAKRKPQMTQIDLHEMALRGARRRLAALEAMKATDIESEAEKRFRVIYQPERPFPEITKTQIRDVAA